MPEAYSTIKECIQILSHEKLRKTYKKMLARSYMIEGLIYLSMRQYNYCEESFNKAIIIFKEYNFPIVILLCRLYLGCLYLASSVTDKTSLLLPYIDEHIKFSNENQPLNAIEMLKKFNLLNSERNGFMVHPNVIKIIENVTTNLSQSNNVQSKNL